MSKFASIVLKAALDFVTSCNALEMLGFQITDWRIGERQVEIELQDDDFKKEWVIFPIFQGIVYEGGVPSVPIEGGLIWAQYLEKWVCAPEAENGKK